MKLIKNIYILANTVMNCIKSHFRFHKLHSKLHAINIHTLVRDPIRINIWQNIITEIPINDGNEKYDFLKSIKRINKYNNNY